MYGDKRDNTQSVIKVITAAALVPMHQTLCSYCCSMF